MNGDLDTGSYLNVSGVDSFSLLPTRLMTSSSIPAQFE